MVESILSFYQKSKRKKVARPDFSKLNLYQFFSQRLGIGKKISRKIFLYSGLHRSIKYGEVENKNYYVLLRYKDFFITKKEYLDYYLEERMKSNIKKYLEIYNLKGKKHKFGLPVRGQRSKTNGKTAKRLRLSL
jgi:small subunit ribosomal protein S13